MQMKKRKKGYSWKEICQMNIRAMQIFYQYEPQLVIASLLFIIWNALTPYVTIWFSAQIIEELSGAADARHLQFLVLWTLLVTAIAGLGTSWLRKWRRTHYAGLYHTIEYIYSEKLLDMDYVNLEKTENLELLSKIHQNQNSSAWGLLKALQSCDTLCHSLFTVLGGFALTISLFFSRIPEQAGMYTILNHPLCMLAAFMVMLGVSFWASKLSNRADRYWATNSDTHINANRLFSYHGFLGMKTDIAMDVRMYEQEKIGEKYLCNKDGVFCSHGMFAKLASGPMGAYKAASGAVAVISTGMIYLYVCVKAWAGAFGLGAVTQYVSAITKFVGGIAKLVESFGDMQNNVPFLQQVYTFLDIPNEMYQGSLTVEKRRDRQYEVEFRNVSFRYPGSEQYALQNVNMKFEIGKRLAVVGMNGSGKTTFIKLLCRLYDPTEGEILLNGIDIRKYNYAEYQHLFSVVFQDFSLLALKLAENVASGEHYDKAQLMDCLEKAGFMENLDKMPDGIETYLYKKFNKDGIHVSGGEAQKLAIARTLYKDAPFLILDEPTAALDPIAEAEIYEKFDEIAGDKTAIYISHRLSSCKFCDEILVFEDGTVIQQGTHMQLLAQTEGKYSELWNAQAQYYAESTK